MRNRRDPLENPALDGLRSALTADPSPDELHGEHEALVAYRAVTWDRSRGWHRPAILATKLGVFTTAGVVALSGVATAAYTGSLPNALQDVAHKTIKAPPAHAKGPDATGPAAHGLCQAFAKDKDKDDEAKEARKAAERAAERAAEGGSPKATPPGRAKKAEKAQGNDNGQGRGHGASGEKGNGKQGSVAYRNLVRAAGGEDKVEAYCEKVLEDKAEAKASESPKAERSAKPTKSPKPAAPATSAPAPRATTESTPSATSEPTAATTTAAPSPSTTG